MSAQREFPVAGIAPVIVRGGKVYWAGDGVWNPLAGESVEGLRDALRSAEEYALSHPGVDDEAPLVPLYEHEMFSAGPKAGECRCRCGERFTSREDLAAHVASVPREVWA